MPTRKLPPDTAKVDRVIAEARQNAELRAQGYRDQALKLYPWVCGRCSRVFTRANLRELTVHHRNHDHDYNPSDGSNWELLCLYCHDNEHARYLDRSTHKATMPGAAPVATGNPLSELKDLWGGRKKGS